MTAVVDHSQAFIRENTIEATNFKEIVDAEVNGSIFKSHYHHICELVRVLACSIEHSVDRAGRCKDVVPSPLAFSEGITKTVAYGRVK